MVKTRFAPSPTGYLHVGGARTALYNWLYAKHTGGQYILRIEDTDRERSTDEATQAILDGLGWLGLDADEGPYFQTQRFDRYKEVIQQLLDEGKAYRCYCSRERLDKLREEQTQQKIKPRYDGHCRDHNDGDPNQPHVIRFKNPLDGDIVIDDQVLGNVVIHNRELDDLIIARSDGTPTYNLTVVVDDFDMGVTHVVRGNDHLNNTPRQINLLQAMGASIPKYAHIPMILGGDGKRLSKRHGAVSVLQFRQDGFLPQALLNYLVRLGWSHGDQEVFTLEEMINKFELTDVNKAPAAFDQKKLLWLNQYYLKNLPIEAIRKELQWHYTKLGVDCSNGVAIDDVITALRERVKTVLEMAEKSQCFYIDKVEYDEEAAETHLKNAPVDALTWLQQQLQALDDWQAETINPIIKACMEEFSLKMPQLAQPLRVAMTGNTTSPSIDTTLYLIGREKVLARLAQAIAYTHPH